MKARHLARGTPASAREGRTAEAAKAVRLDIGCGPAPLAGRPQLDQLCHGLRDGAIACRPPTNGPRIHLEPARRLHLTDAHTSEVALELRGLHAPTYRSRGAGDKRELHIVD